MKIKNYLIGITISILTILLFFAVTEIAIRIIYPNIIPTTQYDWSSRHKGYPLEKAHTTFRIVVLGDSFTFGQGVKKDETFPKRLEVLLNKYGGRVRFEVVNLGFCGLNTGGELEILTERGINPETWQSDERYRGLAYKPDLIILEYTLNDSSTSGRLPEQIKQFDDKWRRGDVLLQLNSGPYSLPIPKPIDKFLTRKSMSYLFFMSRYNRLLIKFGLKKEGDGVDRYSDSFPGWIYTKEALVELGRVSRQYDIPIIMAIFPDLVDLDNYRNKKIHQKIKWIGNVWGLYPLDLLPAFEGMDAESLWANPLDTHPGPRAHEIAARAIFKYLVNEGLIPSF